MQDDAARQTFHCPACGQKHRVSVEPLRTKPNAALRAPCTGCGAPLSIRLDEGGELVASPAEPTAAAPAPNAPTAPAAPTGPAESSVPPDAPRAAPVRRSARERVAPKPSRRDDGAPRVAGKRRERESAAPDVAGKPGAVEAASGDPKAIGDVKVSGDVKASDGAKTTGEGKSAGDPKVTGSTKWTGSTRLTGGTKTTGGTRTKGGRSKKRRGAGPRAGADAPPPDVEVEGAEFAKGDRVGRYTIEGTIGEGGQSIVYRAFDPATNRTVALKVLKPGMSDSLRQRFLREFEVQANIRHPNIMPVFDRDSLPDGRPYFTMELLYRPITFEEVCDRRLKGTLARTPTLRPLLELEGLVKTVLIPIADGIHVANLENGVIHRDLKPGNVLIDSRTLRPYVIDFGICYSLEKASTRETPVVAPTTGDGGVLGTPRFLAPEQVSGAIHARTDVWGLGALLRYAVSGEPPIPAATAITRGELGRRLAALREARESAIRHGDDRKKKQIEEKIVRLEAPDLRTLDDIFRDARDGKYPPLPPTVPPAFAALIQKAMALAPTDRYMNARQFASDLTTWLQGGSTRALREVGGKTAAVAGARRVVERHMVAGLVGLVAALGGFAIGKFLTRGPASASTSTLDLVEADIASLDASIDPLRLAVAEGTLSPLEQRLLYETLAERRTAFTKRLGATAEDPHARSVRQRMLYVTGRFDPALVMVEIPDGVTARARCLLPGFEKTMALERGANRLEPGLWDVAFEPGGVRVPLSVPLVLRGRQENEQPTKEPAQIVLALPVDPTSVPSDAALVIGGRVRARALPHGPDSPVEDVPAFVMQRTEVRNEDFAAWLRTMTPKDRVDRLPPTGIRVRPEDGALEVAAGFERRPVVGVRPVDARGYAAWLATRDGVAWRLPTEAEWVLAAGGALGHTLPGGLSGGRDDAHLIPPLADVGQHPGDVSPYGVRDMLGNARELVAPSLRGEVDGEAIVKGAGVGDLPSAGAIHAWRSIGPNDRDPIAGFRLARSVGN